MVLFRKRVVIRKIITETLREANREVKQSQLIVVC